MEVNIKPVNPNVIILTSGLTGSSVLAGLISRAGYWTGDRTHRKEDYDTFENEELIRLNLQIGDEAGYAGNYIAEFSPQAIRQIDASHKTADLEPYREFVATCNRHQPWIWKDPRLWLTIRFWKPLLDSTACRFILLTRDMKQSWISATLRRQIRSYPDFISYEEGIVKSATQFCEENDLPYLKLHYDELIADPAPVIAELNRFLGTSLGVDDLKAIYRKPLFRRPRSSALDQVKAGLIYLKNYHRRIGVKPRSG
jgi:hypothetical protein